MDEDNQKRFKGITPPDKMNMNSWENFLDYKDERKKRLMINIGINFD
jgi:hypothetical protein